MKLTESKMSQEMILMLVASKHVPPNFPLFGKVINQPWLTNEQTSELFGTNVKTLYNWRRYNGLVSVKIGRKHFYMWIDLFDYMERMHMTKMGPPEGIN